jgi:hypothetical protein
VIKQHIAATALTIAVFSLYGCTTVVSVAHGDPGREEAAPQAARTTPEAAIAATDARRKPDAASVSAVTVTFSDRAQQAAATDPRLTPDEVAVAIERELQAHHLYEPASAQVRRSLAVTVQDFTNSLASNTSLLGFSFRNVALVATIQVQGTAPPAPPPFEVRARARLTTRDVGATGGSLSDLYMQLAMLAVADLRGLAPPEQSPPR